MIKFLDWWFGDGELSFLRFVLFGVSFLTLGVCLGLVLTGIIYITQGYILLALPPVLAVYWYIKYKEYRRATERDTE